MPVMAYSPFAQGALLDDRKLATLAAPFNVTPAQLALAWLLTQPGVIAIPKSSSAARIAQFRAAAGLRLAPGTLAAIDAAYPPPSRARPLRML